MGVEPDLYAEKRVGVSMCSLFTALQLWSWLD